MPAVYVPSQIADINLLGRSIEFGGWSVISSNPGKYGGRQSSPSGGVYRVECIPAIDCTAIRLVYGNWYTGGTGETPNTNPIIVRAQIRFSSATPPNDALGDPAYDVQFGGQDFIVIGRGKRAISDPIYVPVRSGQRFFVHSAVSAACPAAPSAPSCAASGSSSLLTASAYGIAVTIVYPGGIESAASPATSITPSAGQNIVVTAPTSVAGAIGYRVWTTTAGGTTYYNSGLGLLPFGTNATFSRIDLVSAAQEGIERVDVAGTTYFPYGGGVSGSTTGAACNNGEGYGSANQIDLTLARFISPAAAGNVYAPCAILGMATYVAPSVAIIGDSISQGTGDGGFAAQQGGFMQRTVTGQTSQAKKDSTITPVLGHSWLGQGSETSLQFSQSSGWKRSQVAMLSPYIWCNYGTNDLASGSAFICSYLYTIAKRFTDCGSTFYQSTICPKTSSTDGWQSLANQTFPGASSEGYRRAVNNWIVDSTGATTVTGEAMFRGGGGSRAYGVSNTGGDGSATVFIPAYPFLTGTETVQVNGVTKALTTDYTYTLSTSINGSTYISGITFVSAPANGATVTITYTKLPGLKNSANGLRGLTLSIDSASAVEVDSGGSALTNGGFWKIGAGTTVTSFTPSATSSTTLTNGSASYTVDAYRGLCAFVFADSVTGAAVGQVRCIDFNTSTVLTNSSSSWTNTPSTSATIRILTSCYTVDGTHPSSQGHLLMAQFAATTIAGLK